jgi:hypothetical protein
VDRPEKVIGVLDTRHSQAGHAVARACQILGKHCINYYPEFKHEPGYRDPQRAAIELGAEVRGLPAGRSAILFHQAKKLTAAENGYMMPNALKLPESVSETAKEVLPVYKVNTVLIPISSGTIAAGVVKGFHQVGRMPTFIIHMGYSRSKEEVVRYITHASGINQPKLVLIDENYAYKDEAKPGETPPWPCNSHYDLKAFRWWLAVGREEYKQAMLWNIG